MMKLLLYTTLSLTLAYFMYSCSKADNSSTFTAANSGVSGTGGSMARFTIVGNYLYTVDQQNLKVFDISNPVNSSLVNTVPVGFEIETIFPFKNRLFIGSTTVVHIFNIDNPAAPVKLSTAVSPNTIRRCDPVVAKDSAAYATLRVNGPCGGGQSVLATFDIRDIANPIQRNTDFLNEPYGLGYQDSTLYVCERNALSIFSISNGFDPMPVAKLDSGVWYLDVIPYNNNLYAWINTGLAVYNNSNRRNPTLIKKIN